MSNSRPSPPPFSRTRDDRSTDKIAKLFHFSRRLAVDAPPSLRQETKNAVDANRRRFNNRFKPTEIIQPELLRSPGSRPSRLLPSPGSRPSRFLPSPGSRPSRLLRSPGSRPSRLLQSPGSRPSRLLQSPGSLPPEFVVSPGVNSPSPVKIDSAFSGGVGSSRNFFAAAFK